MSQVNVEAVFPQIPTDAALRGIWREHRRYMLDVAYRMLGSVSEAEDIVQEAFTRLLRVDTSQIVDMRSWLVAVVTRLCLDHLRSARARREVYVGSWLPEPVIEPPSAEPDPADRVTLDDSVRMALLVVLERLSPAERAAFVLHDVFQVSFEEVAAILGRSPGACRQLASRARRQVRNETSPARFKVDQADVQRIAELFVTAATSGDLTALQEMLDPNVVGRGDTGGVVLGPRQPIEGREKVIKVMLAFLKSGPVTLVPMPVNGEPGVLAYRDGRLAAVISLSVRDGQIYQVHAIANPKKLTYVASLLGVPISTNYIRPRGSHGDTSRGNRPKSAGKRLAVRQVSHEQEDQEE